MEENTEKGNSLRNKMEKFGSAPLEYSKMIFMSDEKQKEWDELDSTTKKFIENNLALYADQLSQKNSIQMICHLLNGLIKRIDKIEESMPLKPGKENIGSNIKEMEKSGYKKSQAIAASLNEARKSGVKIQKKKEKK